MDGGIQTAGIVFNEMVRDARARRCVHDTRASQ
jgi:hypothetical protein